MERRAEHAGNLLGAVFRGVPVQRPFQCVPEISLRQRAVCWAHLLNAIYWGLWSSPKAMFFLNSELVRVFTAINPSVSVGTAEVKLTNLAAATPDGSQSHS